MNCEQASKLFALYATGDLKRNEEGELDAHLAKCPACASKAVEYETIHRDLESLGRVYRDAEQPFIFRPEGASSARPARWARRRVTRLSFAAAALIAVGVVLPEWLTDRSGRSETQHDPSPIGIAGRVTTRLRTPPVWVRRNPTSAPDADVRRVPRLTIFAGSTQVGSSSFLLKPPSLILCTRRPENVQTEEKPQS